MGNGMYNGNDVYFSEPGAVGITGDIKITFIYLNPATAEYVTIYKYFNKGDAIIYPNIATKIPAKENRNPELVFEEWSSAGTEEELNNLQQNYTVGAVYGTADGKSYFAMKLTKATGLTLSLRLSKINAGLVRINWGDGTLSDYATSANITLSKTYENYGSYLVSTEKVDGTVLLRLGQSSQSNSFMTTPNMLTAAYLGNDVIVSNYTFYNSSLNIATIPNTSGANLENAFSGCRNLKNIIIPPSLSIFGNNVFYGCYNLEHVVLSKNATGFGNYMFNSCYKLKEITIPGKITAINPFAFSSCNTLKKVNAINNGLISLSSNAFTNCHNLEDILTEGIIAVNQNIFNSCYNLKDIAISDGTTAIGASVFQNCMGLTSITIPSSVQSIGGSAFSGCYGIKKYVFSAPAPPTLENVSAFNNINSICKIYVPDESVEAYQTATNWSTYAGYIYPISNMEEEND